MRMTYLRLTGTRRRQIASWARAGSKDWRLTRRRPRAGVEIHPVSPIIGRAGAAAPWENAGSEPA